MAEWFLPIAGIACVYLVAVPIVTLVSKWILRRIRRKDPLALGTTPVYWLLVAPVLVPTAWIASAALHEAEPGRALAACAANHLSTEVCVGALALAFCIAAIPAFFTAITAMRSGVRNALSKLKQSQDLTVAVRALCAERPAMAGVADSVVVFEDEAPKFFATGFLRPRIWLSSGALSTLAPEALLGAIAHEYAHVRSRDPARGSLLSACLSLNPFSRLLRPEAAAWRLAREVDCDREAVCLGARPVELADALVSVARWNGAALPAVSVPLHGAGVAGLELRVRLLLSDHNCTRRAVRRGLTVVLFAAFVLLILHPHAEGTAVMSTFHDLVDRVPSFFGISH